MADDRAGRLTIIDIKNKKAYYVKCSEVPPPNGVGNLTIPYVGRKYKIVDGKEYEELRIPSTCDKKRVKLGPGLDLKIYLTDKLMENSMVLPYGNEVDDPCDHLTLKLLRPPPEGATEDTTLSKYKVEDLIQIVVDRVRDKSIVKELVEKTSITRPEIKD